MHPLWKVALGIFLAALLSGRFGRALKGAFNGHSLTVEAQIYRAAFLYSIFIGPLTLLSPFFANTIFFFYLPFYLDGSEFHDSRAETPFGRWVKGWGFWRAIARYFSSELICEPDFDSKKRYILCIHPHALLPTCTDISMTIGAAGTSHHEKLPRFRLLAASALFCIPIWRDIALGTGMIDAAHSIAKRCLLRGDSLAIIPGGAVEALYCHKGRHVAYLKKRKGFLRLAFETGSAVVPTYSFGESDVWSTVDERNEPPFIRFFKKPRQLFLQTFGFSTPILTSFKPNPAKIVTVIGEPIEFPFNPKPTSQEVNEALERYVEALVKLFNDNAEKYIENPAERKLEIL